MAQTGFTPISNYYSATATNVPTAGNLVAGELAINTADGKLFYKESSGVVQTIATKATAALPSTTTGSGAIVLQTSPSITTPTISSGGANFSGSTSGTINLVATATAGTNTITLPASTGTVALTSQLPVAGPAFSAYRSGSTQSISQSTWTKVQFQTEQFDTASAYDNATNYRFTPLVAGYYQVNLSIGLSFDTLPPSNIYISLYRNGSSYRTGQIISSNPYGTISLSDVVYFNGSTDYIEGYAYSNSASAVVLYQTNNIAAPFCTFFSSTLVRTA